MAHVNRSAQTISHDDWVRLMMIPHYWIVALTEWDRQNFHVSTTWTGITPGLYRTASFYGDDDLGAEDEWFWPDETLARTGHLAVVRTASELMGEPPDLDYPERATCFDRDPCGHCHDHVGG